MSLITHASVAIAISLVISGCGDMKLTGTGAGLTGTVSGIGADKRVTSTFWGHAGADEKLAFIIFTNFDSETSVGSVRGDWWGQIGPKNGRPILVFKGDAAGLEIGGTEYEFENGRVFLATASEGVVGIAQLKGPFSDSDYKAEIDRIAEQREVQEFLNE